MALPVTISAVDFPDQNYYDGPFKSSAGNFFTILLDSGDASIIEAHRATDPTSSFSESDSGNKPNLTNNIISAWVFRVADILHISTQETSTGRVAYHTFDMSGNSNIGTWGTVNEQIEAVTDTPSSMSCSIAVRANADKFVLYNGDTDREMGIDKDRVDYAVEKGAGWTVGITVDNSPAGGAEDDKDYFGSVIVMGSQGTDSKERMHFFLNVGDDDDAVDRTLFWNGSAETLQSWGVADSSAGNILHIFSHGIMHGTSVRCPYLDSNEQISYLEFTSGDNPTATINADVSDNDAEAQNSALIACLSADGTDEHLLYSGGGVSGVDRDLYHDKNDGADVEELDDIDLLRISCNVYDRSGIKLAYVYVDAASIKYNEVVLQLPNLSSTEFPLRKYFVGPIKV